MAAAGFILIMDPDMGSTPVNGSTMTLRVPGIILNDMQASMVCFPVFSSSSKFIVFKAV